MSTKIRRVLVTGGAGYIGSYTCHMLKKAGCEPVVLDSLHKGFRQFVPSMKIAEADLTDPDAVNGVFEKHTLDAVIHFAGLIEVGESVENPVEYYRINVGGGINLLKAMQKHNIRNMVFSSTAAVYGIPSSIPISEESPLAPISPYGWTKLLMEKLIEDCGNAWGLNWAALRYFNAAGADADLPCGEWHDPETHLIPNVLMVADGKRKNFKLFGTHHPTPDGTAIRDYIHVSDLAAAHLKAIEKMDSTRLCRPFNLGLGKGFSVREVIETAIKVTGVEIEYEEAPPRPGDPPELVADPSRALKELEWKPVITSLPDIIESSWKWYQKWSIRPQSR